MTSRAHLSSATDQWPTPQDFFDRLHAEFGFVLDVCADASNAKTPAYYGLDHADPARRDGLAQDWAAEAARLGGTGWMNGPYGRPIGTWMAKARQAATAGATVVALVPVRADTAWWYEHMLGSGAEVRYVRGRLTFGDATNTAAFASAVVIYRPSDVPGQPGPVTTMAAKPRRVRPGKTPGTLIDNYWGNSLPPEQFALAEEVVKATARAMKPLTLSDAGRYLSDLTTFLAGPCGWDRAHAPDLTLLLTERSIVNVTEAATVSNSTKCGRRDSLFRIARTLGMMPASTHKPAATQAPDRFILAGITKPIPVAALVQAHAVRRGAPLAQWSLTWAARAAQAAAHHEARSPGGPQGAGAVGGDAGTLLLSATIQALAEASSPEVTDMASSPTQTTATTPPPANGKAMTRAQRLAFAKKSHALAQAVTAANTPTLGVPPVDTSALNAATLAKCTSFRPASAAAATVWQDNLLLAQRLLLGTRPKTVRSASSYGSSVARFLAWFAAWPGRPGAASGAPITVDELLAAGVIESFVRLEGLEARSASTYRSVVRRALVALDPAPRTTRLRYRPGSEPYQPHEIDQLSFLAVNQRTPGQRVAVCTAIALGAGAGLNTIDLRRVTPAHLHAEQLPDGSTVTMVTVPGPRARTVPVRATFAALLQAALDAHAELGKGEHDLLIGRERDRINVVRPLTSKAHTATGKPIDVHQARLRNTWMVAAMCAPVPLSELMRAAGITTPRPVEILLPYCPQMPQEAISAVLASLADVATGTGLKPGPAPAQRSTTPGDAGTGVAR